MIAPVTIGDATLCPVCAPWQPCLCKHLTSARESQGLVGFAGVGSGHSQVIRHPGEVAGEAGEGEVDALHAPTVAPRNRRGISNCRGDSE